MTLCKHVGCRANATGLAPLPQYGIRTPVPLCPAHGGPQPLEIPMPPTRTLVLRDPLVPGLCRIEGCERPPTARGLCGACYKAADARGLLDVLGAPPNPGRSAGGRKAHRRAVAPVEPSVNEGDPEAADIHRAQVAALGEADERTALITIRAEVSRILTERDEARAEIARLRQAAETVCPETARKVLEMLKEWGEESAHVASVVMDWRKDGFPLPAPESETVAELRADIVRLEKILDDIEAATDTNGMAYDSLANALKQDRARFRSDIAEARQRPALTRETANALIQAGVQVGDLQRHAEESKKRADLAWPEALKAAGVTV